MSVIEWGIALGLFCLIAGYSVGRVSHILGGHLNTPHHWIYGLLLMVLGIVADFDRTSLTISAITIGAGLFVSDFKDFKEKRFFGPDVHNNKNFFGFD